MLESRGHGLCLICFFIFYIEGSSELPSKTTYRILFLGASNTGKTSIVRQFLYDQFSPIQSNTMDDMYRGEFEDSHGKTINFDIQDVGGGFVYDFPAMKSVSVASADAFVLGIYQKITLVASLRLGFWG